VASTNEPRSIDNVLLAALRVALNEPDEQRLYKSVRQSGLFDPREQTDAAQRALRERLLEVTRTEARGGHSTEWVRLTPTGVRFVHAHDAPRAVLRELQSSLQSSRDGMPEFLASMQSQLHELAERVAGDVKRIAHRLDVLSARVEEALKKVDAPAPVLANGVASVVPWASQAMTYLDLRSQAGGEDCPMPELFAALRETRPDLSLREFHDGLRRMAEFRSVTLKPLTEPPDRLSQPEFVLLDGPRVLYFVSR
jgi:hypothetical protein